MASNPLDYGAVMDGTPHPLSGIYTSLALAQAVYPFASALTQQLDWAACQAAINASGGACVLPDGAKAWLGSDPLTWPAGSALLAGAGLERSTLIWDGSAGAGGGVSFTQTTPQQVITIRDLTFVSLQDFATGGNPQRAAISIVNTGGGNLNGCQCVIHNVSSRGALGTAFWNASGFRYGLVYTAPEYLDIKNFSHTSACPWPANTTQGLRASLAAAGGCGVVLLGNVTGVNCVIDMDDIDIAWCDTAIYASSNIEGINLHHPQVVNCNTGLVLAMITQPGQHTVSDGHFNVLEYGVRATDVCGLTVSKIMFFQQANADSPTNALTLTDSRATHVNGCCFFKTAPSSVPFTHVSLGGDCRGSIFSECSHMGGNVGYYLATGIAGVQILDPYFDPSCSTHTQGDLAHTFVRVNVIP